MKKIAAIFLFIFICSAATVYAQDTLAIYFESGAYSYKNKNFWRLTGAKEVYEYTHRVPFSEIDSVHFHVFCDTTGTFELNDSLAYLRLLAVEQVFFRGEKNSESSMISGYFEEFTYSNLISSSPPSEEISIASFIHLDPVEKQNHPGYWGCDSCDSKHFNSPHFDLNVSFIRPTYSDELWKDRKVEIIVWRTKGREKRYIQKQDTFTVYYKEDRENLSWEDETKLSQYGNSIDQSTIDSITFHVYADSVESTNGYSKSAEDLLKHRAYFTRQALRLTDKRFEHHENAPVTVEYYKDGPYLKPDWKNRRVEITVWRTEKNQLTQKNK